MSKKFLFTTAFCLIFFLLLPLYNFISQFPNVAAFFQAITSPYIGDPDYLFLLGMICLFSVIALTLIFFSKNKSFFEI